MDNVEEEFNPELLAFSQRQYTNKLIYVIVIIKSCLLNDLDS